MQFSSTYHHLLIANNRWNVLQLEKSKPLRGSMQRLSSCLISQIAGAYLCPHQDLAPKLLIQPLDSVGQQKALVGCLQRLLPQGKHGKLHPKMNECAIHIFS